MQHALVVLMVSTGTEKSARSRYITGVQDNSSYVGPAAGRLSDENLGRFASLAKTAEETLKQLIAYCSDNTVRAHRNQLQHIPHLHLGWTAGP